MITSSPAFSVALPVFRSGKIMLLVTISGYSKVFTNYDSETTGQYPWLVSVDDLDTSVHDLDGGADQSVLTFNVTDMLGLITADFPTFVFEGKLITLKMGIPGVPQASFVTVFTGYIDTVGSTNANQEYVFSCSDVSSKLQQPIYVVGDDGKPIDSAHPKTLNGHPLDMLLDILSVKLALAGGFIDTTKIQAYRDGPFSGAQFQFTLTQTVVAMDFIKEQLLKPLGGYLWVNAAGVITVNFFYPLAAPVAVATLGVDSWTDNPDAEQVDIVNTIQFQFDKDDSTASSSGNYFAQDTELYQPSITKYGQYGELTIPADGLRSGFQGYFTARLVARMIFLRYGLKNLKFDQGAADALWQTCLIEPGDIVAVTHPRIPNRATGFIGITNRLFEVLNRRFNFMDGRMTFTMIDANFLSSFGSYKITPNGKPDFTLATAGDKTTYMYLCSDTDVYTDATPGHILG